MTHAFSETSLRCLSVLPNTAMLACSSDAGWTSMLARHSRSSGLCEAYETLPTPDQSIVIVTKGAVDVESFERGRWHGGIYRAGSAGLTEPGEADRLRWRLRSESIGFEKLHIFLPQQLISEAADHLRRPAQRAPATSLTSLVFHDGAVAAVATAMVRAMRAGAPNIYAEATAQWLALHLLSVHAVPDDANDAHLTGAISDARLLRALEYMSEHLSDAIDLETLAAEAGVSKFHFVRLFRERTGETPIKCLANLRLEKAARLLATSDLPIGRVAYECGYPNVTHFNSAFRRRYLAAPSSYRHKHRHT